MTNDYQEFQRHFGRYLRDPRRCQRPPGIPARAAAVYSELLFNNVCGFLDACFPVCRELLGESRWRRLNRSFYRDWPLHTPWFREIPREFARYLAGAGIKPPLPAWLAELAHYEWVELAVEAMDAPIPDHDPEGNLLQKPVVVNPACRVLTYAWPVHRIGTAYRPRKPLPTYLAVHRAADDTVRFSELNAVTARLLALLSAAPITGLAALQQIADELEHPSPHQLIAFGSELLLQLRRQGILLGSQLTACPIGITDSSG